MLGTVFRREGKLPPFPLSPDSPLPTLFSAGEGVGERQWDWEHLEAGLEMGVQASPGCTRKLGSQNTSGGLVPPTHTECVLTVRER